LALTDGAEAIEPIQQKLADVLGDLEEHLRPTNALIIGQMADSLKVMVSEGSQG
jgi:hypothetical protein